jgi:hypothetical protein
LPSFPWLCYHTPRVFRIHCSSVLPQSTLFVNLYWLFYTRPLSHACTVLICTPSSPRGLSECWGSIGESSNLKRAL